MQTLSVIQIISIFLSASVFLFIGIVGTRSNLLKEKNTDDSKYSFHKFQLWIWTLAICPLFVLHWGFTPFHPAINVTSLILLGISTGSLITGIVITQTNVSSWMAKKELAEKLLLKVNSATTKKFFVDILSDDSGQLSLPRLQNFLFTMVFTVIYVSHFFSNKMEYINWDNDATPFVLMGISTGTYLFGKSVLK
jgi:hypothetical protein